MKKHISLIVAVAIPIVFLTALFISIFVPSLRIKPTHDFIFAMQSQYSDVYSGSIQYQNTYDIKENKIVLVPVPQLSLEEIKNMYGSKFTYQKSPKLFYYNIKEQTSKEISFEDAQKYSVETGPSSPDGYTVKYTYNNDGIFGLVGSGESSGYVITKGNGKKVLTGIPNTNTYNDGGFVVIGWIK